MKKIISINLFIIIIIILFLEIVSNKFKLSNLMGIKSGLIYIKDGSHFLYPNTTGLIFNEKVFTDKFSFRVPRINFKYDENNKGIFILGDSVAFGNGVKEQDTFIGLLRSKFKYLNFYNNSVPGYQLKDHVRNINTVKDFKNVNKIIYILTLNDIYETSNVITINDGIQNKTKFNEGAFSLRNNKILLKLNFYLRDKSYLYMLIKGLGTDPSKRWFLNVLDQYKKQNFDSFRKDIKKMKMISKKIETKFYVIILPYEFQTRNCSNEILFPQNNIIKILDNLDVKFEDLTKYFCKQIKPKELFYKFDPMHLSKEGHMLVYNLIYDKIKF